MLLVRLSVSMDGTSSLTSLMYNVVVRVTRVQICDFINLHTI